MWSSTETVTIEREVGNCTDSTDLQKLLDSYDQTYVRWHQYINRLVTESGLSYRQLSKRSGLSKNTIRDWCIYGTLPRRRESLIRLGFALGMDRVQIDRLLMYGGGFHGLYPRDVLDAACLFVLNLRKKEGTVYDSLNYEMVRELYREATERSAEQGNTIMTTQVAMERLLTTKTRQEFLEFMSQRSPDKQSHTKLMAYLTEFIEARRKEQSRQEDSHISVHGLAVSWGSDGELEKMLSCLRHHGIVPRRDRLVALGLQLGMNLSELNSLLNYAGMEGLYARDKLECVLIYALQNLEIRYPVVAHENAFLLQNLAKDPQLRCHCKRLVEDYMKQSYLEEDADWTDLSEYVCELLEELDLPEAEWLLKTLK